VLLTTIETGKRVNRKKVNTGNEEGDDLFEVKKKEVEEGAKTKKKKKK
jgi:hypothetical protein